MHCIASHHLKHFILNRSDNIIINNSEISFKIYDHKSTVYYCQVIIKDFIRINVLKNDNFISTPEVSNIINNIDSLEIQKCKSYSLIMKNQQKLLKICYKPLKIEFYIDNLSILIMDIFNYSNGNIYIHTTFKFIKYFYGLPERASLSQLVIGKKYRLYNTDRFLLALKSNKPLYGSIPLLLGLSHNHSIGLLINNTSDIEVELDRTSGLFSGGRIVAKWWCESGSLQMDCFIDRTILNVRKLFMAATGSTRLPPLFALGYHQCRWNYEDQKDLLQVDSAMDKAGIPYDVIWLDIEHTDDKRYMTWDTSKFDPKQLLEHLKVKNRHLVVIIDPHLKVDDNYKIYKEAKDNGYLIKNEDGTDFIGECWSLDSSWVDFISKEACLWWSNKISNYIKELCGSSEYNNLWIWNDMNEPSVFKCIDNQLKPTAKHDGNIDHREVHNIYGQKMAQSTLEGILKATDNKLRPFLLSRSFFTGSQKFGAIWTGDTETSWEHLQISVSMMISLSICGIDFCGADVGGFFGDPSMELLTRWYQLGTLQPFFRAHSHIESKRREPYLMEEPYLTVIKNSISFRYRLLAYWYLNFWLAESQNIPVVSPVWMYYPFIINYKKDEMFMVGFDILARPIVTPNCTSIEIQLPFLSDIWYQYCDVSSRWKVHYGGTKIKIPIILSSLPLFYRGGSCIFMKDDYCSNTNEWQKCPYSIYVFPLKNKISTGKLYIDDYKTFSYEIEKRYFLISFTFDPIERSMVFTKEYGDLNDIICPKINKIIIIKNQQISWSEYNLIKMDGNIINEDNVNHLYDTIEIKNLNINMKVDCALTFH